LGKHERSALTPCSAERFDTRPTPSRRVRTAGSPGVPEGRDIPRVMRVSETIQVREDE
jgi:hypothetical protein